MRVRGRITAALLDICRARRIGLAISLSLAAAGCSSVGPSYETATAERAAPTIAFEAIDGPPPAVIHKLLADLNEAAAARNLAVAPRDGTAIYRARGYLSAVGGPGETTITWAWDLYDQNQQRSFRIRGKETVASGRGRWGSVDDAVTWQIAQNSVEQIVSHLSDGADSASQISESQAPEPAPEARRPSWLLSGLDDFRPEASGIFRLFQGGPISLTPPADDDADEDIPLPRERPTAAPKTASELAALADEQ